MALNADMHDVMGKIQCNVLPCLIDQLAYQVTRGMIRIRPIGDAASKGQSLVYLSPKRQKSASNSQPSEH